MEAVLCDDILWMEEFSEEEKTIVINEFVDKTNLIEGMSINFKIPNLEKNLFWIALGLALAMHIIARFWSQIIQSIVYF